eukprot:2033457-Rhodomonas_salina.1
MVTFKGDAITRLKDWGGMWSCKALAQVKMSGIGIGDEGAGRLARVLGECKALAHLDLSDTCI